MTKLTLGSLEKNICDRLMEKYPGLEIVNYFDSGSTARIFHVRMPIGSDTQHKVERIIKVMRHDCELSTFIRPEEIFRSEIEILMNISHSNLITIYWTDTLILDQGLMAPFYIMEYLPGAMGLDDWIRKKIENLNSDIVVDLLLQAAYGIQVLHKKNIIHCDIKLGNLLVGDGGQLKVSDMGFSKVLKGKEQDTGLYTTFRFFPFKFRQYLQRIEDPSRIIVSIPKNELDGRFDLHYFQGVISDLLNEPGVKNLFSEPELKNLRLIASRMDMDRDTLLPKYKSIDQVIEDLKKLQSFYLNRAGVQELSPYVGPRTIRIPVSGSIPFSKRVQEIISHPLFLRLHNVLQLGFAHYVYPGARHTRFEHSLGVFHNVSRYINSLLCDEYHSYFRQLVDKEKISTTLLAGLLHDIGQHSFAYGLEDILSSARHESIADTFITGVGLDKLVKSEYHGERLLSEIIEKFWPEVKIERLRWLIAGVKPKEMAIDQGWEVMKAIIDGPIDADKIDYLVRDAHHAGVEYPMGIEMEEFINSLTASIYKGKRYTKGVLAFSWKGIQSVENIILARSQMFWVLYWHQAIRAAHAMLAHACFEHLINTDEETRIALTKKFYCGTINELLEHLKESNNNRTQELAKLLQMRCLFKRAIVLDYTDNADLYKELLYLKKKHKYQENDIVLKKMSRDISEAINKELSQKGSNTRLNSNGEDIIVDIPVADKDKLGILYIADKNTQTASEYRSSRLAGDLDNWQYRVRTIRIFVHPHRVLKKDLEYISEAGPSIFEYAVE